MSIEWIPTGAARNIPAKEQGNRGIFPSIKVPGGFVEYESCLERDFFIECDHSPDVLKFQHQPITISYQNKDGIARKYTPDAFVEFKEGRSGLFEIKYESELAEKGQIYEERWGKAREWGAERKITFSVLTERVIRTPRWLNIWVTLGPSKCRSNDSYIAKLAALIPENGERYDELCYVLSESEGIGINKAAQILCYAIYHGLVFLDSFSTQQISNSTIIRPKKRKMASAFSALWDELGMAEMPNGKNSGDSPGDDLPAAQEIGLESISLRIPEKYDDETRTRLSVVNSWLRQPSRNRTAEWRREFCQNWSISEKTVYNWVNAFLSEGIAGLIPRHQRSGRKTTLDPATLELLEKARQIYLAPMGTLKTSYAELGELCEKQGIAVPPEHAFRKYIYRNTTVADFARKRGKTFYKANFTPSLASFQGAFAPMQIVQMDNTSFDLFPVDSEHRETLSTPNLTAAIDCYTRMSTGFSLSYFPSSSHTVLEVLVQSILPKETYATAHGTQLGWPIQGFPVLLLVDNGMDYQSEALKKFCLVYDIILEYAPIRTPRFKAFIEQWFNVVHNALAGEQVPGFRPLLKQRLENPQLKPEAQAVLTLQEIEEWLHRWVLDGYHFTNPYDDHAPAPYLRWQDFQGGRTDPILPLPRDPPADKSEVDLMHLATLDRIERTLGYQGVVWERLRYNNKDLSKVYETIGKEKVEVLLNPRDIHCVWVVPPDASTPIKAELASGWAQSIAKVHGDKPIHASAWKKDVNALKDQLRTRLSPFLYEREMSRIKRDELLKSARHATKTARREIEKASETKRKSLPDKIQPNNAPAPSESNQGDGKVAKGASQKQKKRVDIDWDNLPTLPTDDFPKEA